MLTLGRVNQSLQVLCELEYESAVDSDLLLF